MLRISRLADYGTVVMHYLALQVEDEASASMIAKKTEVKRPTVSKLLKLLQHSGLVTAQRGAQGGYRLAKPAHAISIADIIAAVDGQLALTRCNEAHSCCERDAACGVKENWRLINRVIMTALQSLTLADMKSSLAVHPLVQQGIPVKSESKISVVVERNHGG